MKNINKQFRTKLVNVKYNGVEKPSNRKLNKLVMECNIEMTRLSDGKKAMFIEYARLDYSKYGHNCTIDDVRKCFDYRETISVILNDFENTNKRFESALIKTEVA